MRAAGAMQGRWQLCVHVSSCLYAVLTAHPRTRERGRAIDGIHSAGESQAAGIWSGAYTLPTHPII